MSAISLQPKNGLIVSDFIDYKQDMELLRVAKILERLCTVKDVVKELEEETKCNYALSVEKSKMVLMKELADTKVSNVSIRIGEMVCDKFKGGLVDFCSTINTKITIIE